MKNTTQKTEDKTELFEKMPIPQALKSMIIPTIIGQIIVLIYNMADTFYVGRTNNPLMVAGISLLLPVFNITLCLAGLAGIGGGTLVSRLLGKNQEEEAKRVSAFSLYLAMSIAGIFSVGMGLFMQPMLHFLGAGENTLRYAEQYAFWVIVLGAIPTVLSNVMSTLIRSIGHSKSAGFGIALGGVLNMILDPLFMFVLLPKGYEVMALVLPHSYAVFVESSDWNVWNRVVAGDGGYIDRDFVVLYLLEISTEIENGFLSRLN